MFGIFLTDSQTLLVLRPDTEKKVRSSKVVIGQRNYCGSVFEIRQKNRCIGARQNSRVSGAEKINGPHTVDDGLEGYGISKCGVSRTTSCNIRIQADPTHPRGHQSVPHKSQHNVHAEERLRFLLCLP